jgi:hypothetical protein
MIYLMDNLDLVQVQYGAAVKAQIELERETVF